MMPEKDRPPNEEMMRGLLTLTDNLWRNGVSVSRRLREISNSAQGPTPPSGSESPAPDTPAQTSPPF